MSKNSKLVKNDVVVVAGRQYTLKKSKYATNVSPVHVSDKMSGKMTGIPSVSTSCLANPICLKRMLDGDSICAHCFANTTLSRYTDCGKAMLNNTYLLTESILPLDMLPLFKSDIARIESFGDVQNVTQSINYSNMCLINPNTTFAWWSKNIPIIAKAFDIIGGKPDNVILIESSPKVNVKLEPSSHYVDKVFTVYSKEYIIANDIDINCGARCCNTCRRCYRKDTEADVREQLK